MKTRKIIVIALVMALVAAAGAFAKGGGAAIGVEGALSWNGNGGMPMGGMLTFRVPQLPIIWGLGIDSSLDIGATGDYWFAHGNLASIFSWYAGIGGYVNIWMTNPIELGAGARIPLGLQAFPFGSKLELFLEVAPAAGISIIPTGFGWHLQSALGLRYWF
jgi:hypothetical protein